MWASAENLSIGRFICGFGSAICMVTCSIFMAETVPPKYLGIVGSAVNCGIVTGILVATIVQSITVPPPGNEAAVAECLTCWRFNFCMPGIIAVLGIGLWYMLFR